jgi:hypothetical protein
MRIIRLINILLAISLASGLLACTKSSEIKAAVSIQKTSPSGDVGLISGDTVIFEVDVRANGLISAGQIALVVQSSSGDLLGTCDPVKIVDGEVVRLTSTVVVPDTQTIQIFTPLYLGNSDQSDILDTRSFKVLGKRNKN